MNVLTKNYGIENGERKYLTYLLDGDKPLECIDSKGEVERSGIEMDLLNKHDLTLENLTYITLEEYYRQELKKDEPLILVFYLDRGLWEDRQMVATYGENVKKYFDTTGDDVRLFFLPTDKEERIECINPLYITEQKDVQKLNTLTDKLEELFQVGVESIDQEGDEMGLTE
tara:strand:- start:50 stop:562 length:513 start_codon:yes stop_codon:yes gene_type:complete